MKNKFKIVGLVFVLLIFLSTSALADIKVENKSISLDLSPEKISDSTYLPLENLAEQGFFNFDKIDENRYFVLTDEAYYGLEASNKTVKSNLSNRELSNPPLTINGHFLIPVEFIRKSLNLRVESLSTDSSNDFIERDNLRLRLYLNDDEFDSDEKLELSIELMNTENRNVNLRFNSAQKYNIYIKNRFGRTVYSWAENKFFSQAVQHLEIKGRDSRSFREEIDLRQLSEGRYTVEVEILAENYNFEIIERQFSIDD